MSNGIATQADVANPFLSYAEAANRQAIQGDLLKFAKHGEWEFGQNGTTLPVGTRLLADMDNLMVGWQRWSGGRPDEQKFGRVMEAHRPERREELGDNDKEAWDVDDRGVPQDPWRLTNILILKDPNDGSLYTYSPSSKGGVSCIAKLCAEFGKIYRQRPTDMPVIELQSSSYKHERYGRIFTPEMNIVSWVPKTAFTGESTEVAAEPAAVEDYKGAKGGKAAAKF
jgi:hypothetical protein